MPISEERANSVLSLNQLLVSIIKQPEEWWENKDLIKILGSQGRFAKLEDINKGIIPCSLNTLKAAANSLLDDGYYGLDSRRISALTAIEAYLEKQSKPKYGTKTHLNAQIKEYKKQVCLLEQQNMILTFFVQELQSKVYKFAEMNPGSTTRAKCAKEMNEIHIKLSFSGNEELIKKALTLASE